MESSVLKLDATQSAHLPGQTHFASPKDSTAKSKSKSKSADTQDKESSKRRCVSAACIACRKRKSKCDGGLPSCAACASVYHTPCEYDPNSDNRRKGVYRNENRALKTRNSTLQTLVQAILNWPQEEVAGLVQQIRASENLDRIADLVTAKSKGPNAGQLDEAPPGDGSSTDSDGTDIQSQLLGRMGELVLDEGSMRFIGGTSNLLFDSSETPLDYSPQVSFGEEKGLRGDPKTSWTTITSDASLIQHLFDLYFSWHYGFFTILSKELFYQDFNRGHSNAANGRRMEYCTPLLVNAVLAVACHFSSLPAAREIPDDPTTAGDHFFREAKRLTFDEGEFERPALASVQALALMSLREAGCGRESRGWVYSGMAFRMACDLGLNLQVSMAMSNKDNSSDDDDKDARKITFLGCFLVDKCWSNYLGRLPSFHSSHNSSVPRVDVFPSEDAAPWSPVSDDGLVRTDSQPSRTRAVALRILDLSEISGDLLAYFYHPNDADAPPTKQEELKRLSDIHTRLEKWKKDLPKEMDARDGQLPSVLIMHMFFHLLYIHLFRPFLKYKQTLSPLPSHVSPRRYCTQAALAISKLLRTYKRTHGLRRIVNIAVYIAHSACTVHLLNLPEKTAQKDFVQTVKHLEEISQGWTCALKTLRIINDQARAWKIDVPAEAMTVLASATTKAVFLSNPVSPSPQSKRDMTPGLAMDISNDAYQELRPSWELQGSQDEKVGAGSDTVYLNTPTPALDTQTARLPLQNFGNNSPAGGVEIPPGLEKGGKPSTYVASSSVERPPTQQFNIANKTQPNQLQNTIHQDIRLNQGHRRASAIPQSTAEMFGGVEALLRDGHDWWIKDQSQLARGFGNWGSIEPSQQVPRPQTQIGHDFPASASTDQPLQWQANSMSPDQRWPVDPVGVQNDNYTDQQNSSLITEIPHNVPVFHSQEMAGIISQGGLAPRGPDNHENDWPDWEKY